MSERERELYVTLTKQFLNERRSKNKILNPPTLKRICTQFKKYFQKRLRGRKKRDKRERENLSPLQNNFCNKMFSFMLRDEWKSENARVFVEAAAQQSRNQIGTKKTFPFFVKGTEFYSQAGLYWMNLFLPFSFMAIILRVDWKEVCRWIFVMRRLFLQTENWKHTHHWVFVSNFLPVGYREILSFFFIFYLN